MATRYIAQLENDDLPVQFSYKPYTPIRRTALHQGVNSVIRQVGDIVPSDVIIAWECRACCADEYEFFLDLMNDDDDPTFTFEGYWGEILEVKFHTLDPPSVRGALFDISGSFQVVSITTLISL